MGNITLKSVIAVFVLALAGCAQQVDFTLAPEITVYFNKEGKDKLTLSSSDEAYLQLAQWLQENNDDWLSTSGNYPGGLYIQTGDHGVQVTTKHAILYSDAKVSHIQNIRASELTLFRQMLQ